MHHQMSNTSIPERWNSTKQLKLLFVCAQRLKDCEMNISRVARGAAVTGLGKNHSECWECWYWMKPRFKRQRGNWSWRGTWWLPSFWVAPEWGGGGSDPIPTFFKIDQNLICLGTAHKCNETHNTWILRFLSHLRTSMAHRANNGPNRSGCLD